MANKEEKGSRKAKTEKEPKDFSKVKRVIQSKAFKGASITITSALIGAGVTYLTTNSNSETKALITMKGDTITVSDFYSATKNTSSSQQTMLNLILPCVFEGQYGDKVSDDDISEAYSTTAPSYSSSFSNALSAAGLTSDAYKQQVRTPVLVEYTVGQAAKKKLTAENCKIAYENYNPNITAIVIALSNEDTVNSVHDRTTVDGADFKTIAKDNTTADRIECTFDSAGTDLPEDVMNAAFNQDEGSISDVIKVLGISTYFYTYYIVKTTRKAKKSSDWKAYKKRLRKIVLAQYESDTDFQDRVIAKVLDKANVKIKDDNFAGILSQYITSSPSSSSSGSSSSNSSSSSSGDGSPSSSTEESFTAESSDE